MTWSFSLNDKYQVLSRFWVMVRVLVDQVITFSSHKQTVGFLVSRDTSDYWRLVNVGEGGDYKAGMNPYEEEWSEFFVGIFRL